MCGISISIQQRISSMFMSGAYGARSIPHSPIRSFIQSAGLDIVSVLLAKTLRSRTFLLALIAISIFGAVVIALFFYVYQSTASFVRSRADQEIAAELQKLEQVQRSSSRDTNSVLSCNQAIGAGRKATVCLFAIGSNGPAAPRLRSQAATPALWGRRGSKKNPKSGICGHRSRARKTIAARLIGPANNSASK